MESSKEDLQLALVKLKEELSASRVKEQNLLQKTVQDCRQNELSLKAYYEDVLRQKKSEYEALNLSFESSEKARMALDKKATDTQMKYTYMQAQLHSLEKKYEAIAQELKASSKSESESAEKHQQLRTALAQSEKRLLASQKQCNEHQCLVEDLNARIRSLEFQLKDSSLSQLQTEQERNLRITTFESLVPDLNRQINELSHKNCVLVRDLERYRLEGAEQLSKFEELTSALSQVREFAEKMKHENSRLVSDNAQCKQMERNYAALQLEFKRLAESEKQSKKKEQDATQKLQHFVLNASDTRAQLEDQVAVLNKQFNQSMVTVNEQSQQIFILKEKLHRTAQEMAAIQQDNSYLSSEAKSRSTECLESRAQLAALSEKLAKCEASDISLIGQLTKLRAAKTQSETQIQSLTTALEELSQQHRLKIAKFEQEESALRSKLSELEAKREKERMAIPETKEKSELANSAKQREHALLDQRNKELSEKLDSVIAEKQRLDSLASECQQKLSTCESEKLFLKSVNEELQIANSNLAQEIEHRTAELNLLLSRENALAENSKQLAVQNSVHNTGLASQLAECERERAALIKLTEKQKCRLMEFEAEITTLRVAIVDLNVEREKELADAVENNQRLNSKAVDKYNSVLAEVQRLQQLNLETKAELEPLNAKLIVVQDDNTSLRREYDSKNSQLETLRSQLTQSKKDHAALNSKLSEVSHSIASNSEAANADRKAKYLDAKSKLLLAAGDLAVVNSELASIKQENKSLLKTVDALKLECRKMEILVANHARDRESLEAKIAEFESAEKNAKLRDFELECEISKLRTESTYAARKLDESRESNQQLLQQQLREREKLAVMRGENEAQQRQLATMELNYQELEKSFCELTRTTQLLENDLTRVREENLRLRAAEISLQRDYQRQAKKEEASDELRTLQELEMRETQRNRTEARLAEVEREREALAANVKELANELARARVEMEMLRTNQNQLEQMQSFSITEEEFAQSEAPCSLNSHANCDFGEEENDGVDSAQLALQNEHLQSVIRSMQQQNARMNSLIASMQANVKELSEKNERLERELNVPRTKDLNALPAAKKKRRSVLENRTKKKAEPKNAEKEQRDSRVVTVKRENESTRKDWPIEEGWWVAVKREEGAESSEASHQRKKAKLKSDASGATRKSRRLGNDVGDCIELC